MVPRGLLREGSHMDFKAEGCMLTTIMMMPKMTYFIPRYQRPYSWKKEQIEDFWEDLNNSFYEETGFFFGTMIFCPEGEDRLAIVDGQQRFTTATILLAALRDSMMARETEKAEKKAREVQESLLFTSFNFGDSRPTLSVQDEVGGYFRESFQTLPAPKRLAAPPISSSRHRMYTAYNFFVARIEEKTGRMGDDECIDHLYEFCTAITRIQLISINVPKQDDAYSIFETVNARGSSLDASDLIKNHIFRKVRPDGKRDSAQERWGMIKKNLTGYDDDSKKEYPLVKFIRYHYLSKYGFCKNSELYKKVRDNKDLDMNDYLDELVSDSRVFGDMLNGRLDSIKFEQGDYKYKIRAEKSLGNLGQMGIDQHYVFSLCLMRNFERLKLKKPSRAHEILKTIEKFNFVYHTVSGKPANKVETLYSRCAVNLENACASGNSRAQRATIETLQNRLKGLVPNINEFKEKFSEISYKRSYKSRAIIRYIFGEFESLGSTDEKVISRDISIEHILPKKPDKWGYTKTQISSYVNNIGNLVLVSQPLNSKASNSELDGKLDVLADSEIMFTRETVEQIRSQRVPEWGEKQIKARNEDLAERGYREIWMI